VNRKKSGVMDAELIKPASEVMSFEEKKIHSRYNITGRGTKSGHCPQHE